MADDKKNINEDLKKRFKRGQINIGPSAESNAEKITKDSDISEQSESDEPQKRENVNSSPDSNKDVPRKTAPPKTLTERFEEVDKSFLEYLAQHDKENPISIRLSRGLLPPKPGEKIERLPHFYFPNKEKKNLNVKNYNDIVLAYKAALGATIRDLPGTVSALERAARALGVPYNAEDGTLRCPAGTPAANQFTNLQMSNCIVPSARTLGGAVVDAVGDAVDDAVKPSPTTVARLLGGAMSATPGEYVGGPDKKPIPLMDDIEAARRRKRYEDIAKERMRQLKVLFSDLRTDRGIRKALLQIFPNIDKESLEEFVNARPQVATAEELLNFFAARANFVAGLIYEASFFNDRIKDLDVVFEDITGNPAGVMFYSELKPISLNPDGSVKDKMTWAISYNTQMMVNTVIQDKNFLSLGNLDNFDDIGQHQYHATHEVGHLLLVMGVFDRLGIKPEQWSRLGLINWFYDEFTPKLESFGLSPFDDDWTAAGLTPEEERFGRLITQIIQIHEGELANDRDKAYKLAAEMLEKVLSFHGIKEKQKYKDSTGADQEQEIDYLGYDIFFDLDEKFGDGTQNALLELLGSKYAIFVQTKPDGTPGEWSPVELYAELFAAMRYFPEYMYEGWDKLRSRDPNLPELDEIWEHLTGLDTKGKKLQMPEMRQLTRRDSRLRKFIAGYRGKTPKKRRVVLKEPPLPTDEEIQDLAKPVSSARAQTQRIQNQRAINQAVSSILDYYTQDEIRDIIDALPLQDRYDKDKFDNLILNSVPEKLKNLRSPSGVASTEELAFNQLLAEAIRDGHISYEDFLAKYIERGGFKGPRESIRRQISAAIGRAAANRRARKSKPSLGGAMSLDDDDLEDATILNHSAANYGVYNPLFGVPPTPGQSRDYLSPGARAEFDRRWPPKPNKDRGVPTATAWMKDLTDQELIDEILAHYAFASSTQVLTLEERRHQKETMAALLKEKRRRNLWVGRKYQGRPGGQRRPSPNQQNRPLPTVNPTPVSPTPTPVSPTPTPVNPTPTPVSPTPTPQPRPPKPTKPNTPTPQPAKPNQPLPTPGPQPTPSTPSPGTNRPTSPGKKIPQPANKTDQEFFDDWTKADFGDEVIPGWVKVKPSSGKDGDLEIQYTKDGRTFTIERKTDSRGNEIYELWEWHTGTEGGNTPHGRESAENSNAIYNLIDTHSKLVGQPNPLDDDDTADDLTTKQNDLFDDYDSARVGDEVIDGWKKFDQVSFEDGEEVRTLINDSGTGVIFQRKTKDGKIKYDFALVDQDGNLIDEGKDYDSFDGVVNKINRAQVSNDEDNDEFEEIQDIIDSNNIDKASRVDIPSGTAPDGWSTTKETRTTPKGRKTIDLGFTHTSENYYDDDADRRYKVQEYIDPNTGQRKLRVREENRKDASDRWSTDNEVILGNFDNWDDVNSAIANRQNQRRPDERHFDRNGWSLERGRDGEVASQVLETETRRRGQTTETVPTTTQRTWTPQNNDPNGPQYKIHEFNNRGTNIYVVSRHELNDDGTEDVVNIPFQSWPEARLAVEDDQNNISRLNAGDSVALPTRRGQQTTDGLTDAPSGPGLTGWKKRTLVTRKFYPTGEKDKNGNWIQRPAYVGIEYMPDDFDDDDSPVKYSIISSTNPRTPNYTVHRHVRRDDGTYDIQSGEYDTWADALDAIEQDRNAVNAAIADGWNPNERPAKPRAVIADIDDRSGGQGDYIEPEIKQLSDEELIRRYEGIRRRFLEDRQKAIDENENFPASRRTRLNNYEDELQTRGLMVFDGGAPDPLDEEEGYAEIDGQIIDIETGEIISLKTDDKPSLGGGMSYVSRTSIPDASRNTVNMRPRERQKTRKLKPRQPLGPQAYEIEFDLLNNPKYAKAMEFLAFYGKHDGPSSITNINQLDNIVNRMKRIKLRGKNNKPLADDSKEMKNWYEAISKISEMYHTNLMEIDDPDNNIMIVDEGVNTDDVRQKLPSNTRFIKPNNTDLDDSEIGQPGVSQRKIRRITNNERRRLGGAMSGATNVGSVKRDDGDVVTSKPYRPIELDKVEKLGYFKDGEESVDTLPVYTIGNKKIAFGSTLYGNEKIEFDGVEVVPLNPYVISNNSIESDTGRQIAVDWWNATAGAVSENPDNGALASALLYAAARGDEDARIEFERLAKIGSDIRSEEINRDAQKIIDAASGIDWTATDRYTANDHIVWDGDTKRPVELRDLIAVHQTNYEPTIDANGNLILRPVEDYGDNRRDETDGPLRFHRGSLHLSLNHLVTGHIGRQSPTGKTFAIAFNLEKAIKANPDSLDNLYAVDTVMTPKPGQGLIIPKGSFEFIELPSAESLGIEIPSPVDRQKITTQEMQERTKISERFQEAQRKAVEELLSTLGKRFNGESYTTPIFPGGEHGSTGPLQNRLRYLAALERVQSNLHNYLPHREFEKISAYNNSKERNISRIASPRTSQLSINAIMRIAASDRFTSAKTTSDGGSVSRTNRDNFMPPKRAQNFLAD